KVTFDGAGGGGEMLAEAVQSSTYILPENKFIAPDKKVFKNWSVGGWVQINGSSRRRPLQSLGI
ncbi:MAG: hypothetical protein J6L71_01610, partial [Clostridia bacterium]|nr:hypothetical protein [Clostridia bacterium]